MIEVGVHEVKLGIGLFVFESDPCDHATIRVSPGGGGDDFGGVGEPEMIVLEGFKAVVFVKDGHELAPAAAIATGADPGVLREVAVELLKLVINAFLGAEDIRIGLGKAFLHDGAAVGPSVGFIGAGVAEIVGHDLERISGQDRELKNNC